MPNSCRDTYRMRDEYRFRSAKLVVLELRRIDRAMNTERRQQRTPKPENAKRRPTVSPVRPMTLREIVRLTGMT